MKVTKVEKLFISGISVITNNKNEENTDTEKISPLWNEYLEKDIFTKTFNKSNDSYLYGVYSDYESDFTGDFKVTVGCEVTKPKNAIKIENQRYLVFSKKGEFPDVVIELWEEIWAYFSDKNSEYKRAYKVDFEKYISMEDLEIYISIN